MERDHGAAEANLPFSSDPSDHNSNSRNIFDGGENGGSNSLAENPNAVRRLITVLKEMNASNSTPTGSQYTHSGKLHFGQYRSRSFCIWGWLIAVAYAILIASFIGVIFAVLQLNKRDISSKADFMETTKTANPIDTENSRPFLPLPLLWAYPLEYYQQVPSVMLQMDENIKSMYSIYSVQRDYKNNITVLHLFENMDLIVTPDMAELRKKGTRDVRENLVKRWEFNPLWELIYENHITSSASSNIGEGGSGSDEERIKDVIDNINDYYSSPSLITNTSPISSSDSRSSGDSLLTELPEAPSSSSSSLSSPIASSPPLVSSFIPGDATMSSFVPLLSPQGRGVELVNADNVGVGTPPSAMPLSSNTISPIEDGRDGMKVLNGFPDPPVDPDEPILFDTPSGSDGSIDGSSSGSSTSRSPSILYDDASSSFSVKRLKLSGGSSKRRLKLSVDELFKIKINTIRGLVKSSAYALDTLNAMGGAFLAPAVKWSSSFPFTRVTAPFVAALGSSFYTNNNIFRR